MGGWGGGGEGSETVLTGLPLCRVDAHTIPSTVCL